MAVKVNFNMVAVAILNLHRIDVIFRFSGVPRIGLGCFRGCVISSSLWGATPKCIMIYLN